MSSFQNFPEELRNRHQWVNWRVVMRDGKDTKMPFKPTGYAASSTERKTWSAFQQVVNVSNRFSGIGFVFDSEDPYIGIDLDGCRDPETGKLDEWAKEVVLKFNSYTEVSPSGTGVKIFAVVDSHWPHRNKVELKIEAKHGKTPGVEVYESGRYFAVTGRRLQGQTELACVDDHLNWLADKFSMRQPVATVSGEGVVFDTPVIERALKYIERMDSAISGQSGHNATFHVACVLVKGFSLSDSEAMQCMRQYNKRCEPPWSDRELEHKIKSATKQPGAVGFLKDARPDEWSKIRLPGNYLEHRETPIQSSSTVRRTTLKDAAKKFVGQLALEDARLIETGIPELDYALDGGVDAGEVMIVAARPSHGKSLVALQMAHHMSAKGLPIMVVSEEMAELQIGKRVAHYVVTTPKNLWKQATKILDAEIDNHFHQRANVEVIEFCRHIDTVLYEIERSIQDNKTRIVIVDYAQLLDAKGRDAKDRVSNVSKSLKQMANKHGILIILLAQLNRDVEDRKKFIPIMRDLKDAGQLEQDADVIVFGVWPWIVNDNIEKSNYQLFVCKNRNREIKKHFIECIIEPERQRLIEVGGNN